MARSCIKTLKINWIIEITYRLFETIRAEVLLRYYGCVRKEMFEFIQNCENLQFKFRQKFVKIMNICKLFCRNFKNKYAMKNDSEVSEKMQESNVSIEYLTYHNSIIFIITKTIVYRHTVTTNMAYKQIMSSEYKYKQDKTNFIITNLLQKAKAYDMDKIALKPGTLGVVPILFKIMTKEISSIKQDE
ncbi:hypothetical protein AGLY_008707 [Aphis glycines]|uniref:Uncharacterized protein n=1 Tax=Aphis glycines TaxID=307491 RepID=A0A6G0TLK8_APHGL|nr:hypothetical protein AGLY_008707 [Aphis glycines]